MVWTLLSGWVFFQDSLLGKRFGHILLKHLCKTGGKLTIKGRMASSKAMRENGMDMGVPAGFLWYQRTQAEMLTGS